MGSICSSSGGEERKLGATIETETAIEKTSSKGEFLLSFKTGITQNGILKTTDTPRAVRLVLPLEISHRYSLMFDSQVRYDFSKRDFRAFCLLIHRKHGGLLLHCTRKKKKPPHYQLPGGNIDEGDLRQVTRNLSSFITQKQLYSAARLGCAREVYEETGLDFRKRLEEFLPMILYSREQRHLNNEALINEYKSRIFFVCEVFDEDFPYAERDGSMRFSSTRFPSLPSDFSCDLMLQLSVEHSGFCFLKETFDISKTLRYHSGGKVEEAVTMAYNLVN